MLSPGCLVRARPDDADVHHAEGACATAMAPASAGHLAQRVTAALPWPLPALLAWAAAWAVFAALYSAAAPVWLAAVPALAVPLVASRLAATRMRRLIVLGGFPASLLASGAAAGMPAWAWLAPLAALAWLYPRSAWRDAPLFPTPRHGLDGLRRLAPLPRRARVLDAGCGLGHGLSELRANYPDVQLKGIERSRPIAWLARLRCPWAAITQGDMWSQTWRGLDLVYLFQRPESMPRAVAKARAELAPGAGLASLEFPAAALQPHAVLRGDGGRTVWLYRAPFSAVAHGADAASRKHG